MTNITRKNSRVTGLTVTRRQFTTGLAATGLAAPAFVRSANAAGSKVKMAAIIDLSGGLDIYGTPMHLAMQMAVDEINDTGGLNGLELELITYDTQSNMQLYAQFAQQAALQDQVDFVHGSITSASREVIRPILKRYNTLFLYSTLYEGGVCDRNTFCTGTTPAQGQKEPIYWAVNEWGKNFYSVGADYNAPRIMADWSNKYGKEVGAEMVANEFFPLSVTEFGPLITKIQAAKPKFVVSTLVGAAHLGFYRQWAAAGMVGEIPILSYTFGAGGEQTMIPAEESEGIMAAYSYFMESELPENQDFVMRYHAKHGADAPYQTSISIGGYEGTWLWANAVRQAGTHEREAVTDALEAGTVFKGPGGTMTMDGATHHCIRDISLAECRGAKWQVNQQWPGQLPLDTVGKCDLVTNPDTNTQFTPD